MTISVVIPTLDEAARIASTVESVTSCGRAGGGGLPRGPDEDASGTVDVAEVEVIVVDGGSRDETPRLAREAGARVFESARGRARQLRMGGERSTGDAVLFLHADTLLASGWWEAVRAALADPACAGGAFRLRFAERGGRERWLEFWAALRVAVLGLPYGDQGIFLRRDVLEEMGGVPEVPIMEDLDLVRAIKRAGRLTMLPLAATTSSRRYGDRGLLRTVVDHQYALLGWWLGWDRARIAERIGR